MPREATEVHASGIPSGCFALSSQHVNEPGVFLLLNGLLCRTADASGQFRPMDIFAGMCREAQIPAPALPVANHNHVLPPGSSEDTELSIDSDCPLFNSFGVLSGGVIIDPVNEYFIEYTDSVLYTPKVLTAHDDPARQGLQWANENAFRNGQTRLILPEYPLTLCTSEMPLPPRYSDVPSRISRYSSDLSNAPLIAGPEATSLRHAAQVAMENIKRWSTQLAPYPDRISKSSKTKACTALWSDADELRLSMRTCRDVRANPTVFYLPPRVPLPLRFRGQSIALSESPENSSPADAYESTPDHEVGSLHAVPPDGVRCAASSFTCYTGVPRFAGSTDTAPRSDVDDFSKSMAVVRLRKRLRPYTETASISWRTTSFEGEEEEKFLVPLTGATPRQAAFLLFFMYFNHLGILCNGVRVTGETLATSCFQGNNRIAKTWGICPSSLYDVHAEVERKRRVTRELRGNTGLVFPGGTRWSTAPKNRDGVAAAWTALLLSSRTALLERITVLNSYLYRLHNEKQGQKQ